LETRLDNVVYRMGFAVTRPAARQLVSHRGVTVNGKPVNLPSYQVKAGDAIVLSEKAQKQMRVQEALNVSSRMDLAPSWIEVDQMKFSGVFKAAPDGGVLPADRHGPLIVELYPKYGLAAGHPAAPPTTPPGPCPRTGHPSAIRKGLQTSRAIASTDAVSLQETLRI